MASNTRSRLVPAIILVALGVLVISIQFFPMGAGLELAALGLTLLLGYYMWARMLRLIVPGLLLVGVGAAMALEQTPPFRTSFEPLLFLFLGIPFVLVRTLHTGQAESWRARNWPILPALIFGVLAIALLVTQSTILPKQ